VRIRAAALLAAVPTTSQPPADRERFERAAAEFVAAQRLNADRPEARTALGNFFAQRGLVVDAEAEYKAALRLAPQFTHLQRSISPIFTNSSGGMAMVRACCAQQLHGCQMMQDFIMRWASL
jgi:hypothetical protein